MVGLQAVVELSTIIILVLTVILAYYLTLGYMRKRNSSYLFWSLGLWSFAIGVILEIAFAFGVYSEFLIDLYLLVVVLIVDFLAMGSIRLLSSKRATMSYDYFVILSSVLVLISLLTSNVGNIIQNYVVFGNLPLSVILTSSLATFPAAIVIIVVAAMSYRKTRSVKMLSIIAGVIVVSIAGTLYIASIPEFLYFSEFFGILLLWLGFFDFSSLRGKMVK